MCRARSEWLYCTKGVGWTPIKLRVGSYTGRNAKSIYLSCLLLKLVNIYDKFTYLLSLPPTEHILPPHFSSDSHNFFLSLIISPSSPPYNTYTKNRGWFWDNVKHLIKNKAYVLDCVFFSFWAQRDKHHFGPDLL